MRPPTEACGRSGTHSIFAARGALRATAASGPHQHVILWLTREGAGRRLSWFRSLDARSASIAAIRAGMRVAAAQRKASRSETTTDEGAAHDSTGQFQKAPLNDVEPGRRVRRIPCRSPYNQRLLVGSSA